MLYSEIFSAEYIGYVWGLNDKRNKILAALAEKAKKRYQHIDDPIQE